MFPQLFYSLIIKWVSLKEDLQDNFVRKICINKGEPSRNSPFTSKFEISCICIESTAEIFVILVHSFITYSLIVPS